MHAKLAAGKVKVEYEELPAIIDLHQAIEAKSFIKGTERTLKVCALSFLCSVVEGAWFGGSRS